VTGYLREDILGRLDTLELGRFIGTVLDYGGAFLVASIAKWPPLVSCWTVLIAFVFSACIGLFFGIYPANKAAKLNPIEALRRD